MKSTPQSDSTNTQAKFRGYIWGCIIWTAEALKLRFQLTALKNTKRKQNIYSNLQEIYAFIQQIELASLKLGQSHTNDYPWLTPIPGNRGTTLKVPYQVRRAAHLITRIFSMLIRCLCSSSSLCEWLIKSITICNIQPFAFEIMNLSWQTRGYHWVGMTRHCMTPGAGDKIIVPILL